MKPKIDEDKIKELLTRGVENIYPNYIFLEHLLKFGKQLKIYTGYDPTAPTLHIGHGVTLLKLRQFQDLGHKIIMLIGDFTGRIGDPTDKLAARQQLTREEVLKNCKEYKKQASAFLDFEGENSVKIRYNSAWLSKMSWDDALELSAHITVQRLLERDMFQERLKEGKPIYLHEFSYPLMQGYDSVALDVDGEVGGNDQTFNMLVGRDLMKDLKNREKFVLTMKLLTDSTGRKMGKSEGNMVTLSDAPEDMFGKVMSWPDEMIVLGLELCTKVPLAEIRQMEKELKDDQNPRNLKLELAREIVSLFLGEQAAKQGQSYFAKVIQSKDKPSDMTDIEPSVYDVLTVLVESKICASRGEARRQIRQGGVKVNGKKIIAGAQFMVPVVKKGDVVQKGSRWFVKVK